MNSVVDFDADISETPLRISVGLILVIVFLFFSTLSCSLIVLFALLKRFQTKKLKKLNDKIFHKLSLRKRTLKKNNKKKT